MKGLRVLSILIILLFFLPLSYGETDKKTVSPSAPLYSLSVVSFTTSSSNVINYGDEITLKWTIKGNNIKGLKLEISPDIGIIPLSRTDYPNENFTIEGSKKIKPSKSGSYIIKVSGQAPYRRDVTGKTGETSTRPGVIGSIGGEILSSMVSDQKELYIKVKKAKIENVKPIVDQKTLKIKFLARNNGDGDLSYTPINLRYSIKGPQDGLILAEGGFTTPNLNIRVGEQVELGSVTLPDRTKALNENAILINVNISPVYKTATIPGPRIDEGKKVYFVEDADSDSYEHRWETKTLVIDNQLLDIYAASLKGHIRLNTFDGSKGKVLTKDPYKGNDSYIEIMGHRQNFSLSPFEYTKGKVLTYDYKGYIDDMNAFIEGREAFSIENGKIKLKISFETHGTEIKGYEYTWGAWNDLTAPDYNFTQFDITIFFIPGLTNGRITYKDVQVISQVKGDFVGAYEVFLSEKLEDDIDKKIRQKLAIDLKVLLMGDYIRTSIENKINEIITKTFNIFRITNLLKQGGSIAIEYIEN